MLARIADDAFLLTRVDDDDDDDERASRCISHSRTQRLIDEELNDLEGERLESECERYLKQLDFKLTVDEYGLTKLVRTTPKGYRYAFFSFVVVEFLVCVCLRRLELFFSTFVKYVVAWKLCLTVSLKT